LSVDKKYRLKLRTITKKNICLISCLNMNLVDKTKTRSTWRLGIIINGALEKKKNNSK